MKQFIAEGRSPYTDRPMKASYLKPTEDQLLRSIRAHEHLRAMDVDRPVLDVLRAQAGTARMVRQNTTALRALLLWGYRHPDKFFTAAQAEMLPDGVVMPNPSLLGTAMPSRRRRGRTVGEAADYVRSEDAPSAAQVIGLGRELEVDFPLWGRLAVEFAANSRPRWGEQFQLTAYDVHLRGCARTTTVRTCTSTGRSTPAATPSDRRVGAACPRATGPGSSLSRRPRSRATRCVLHSRARVLVALLEQEAGSNPEALLFPANRGGLLWYTAFETKKLVPAMRRAGWPLQPWLEVRDVWSKKTQTYRRVERERTMALLPWHSLRHRFARIMIDDKGATPGQLMALGGWEDEQVVKRRYYKTGREHTDAGLALFE